VYSRSRRKVKVIFAIADSLLIWAAFEAAYHLRSLMPFEREFYVLTTEKLLLLGSAMLTWVVLGFWMEIYDRLDSALPSVVLRDTFRQCLLGGIGIVLVEFLARLDLSRFFIGAFVVLSWMLLCLFRLNVARLSGGLRRTFGVPHYVMLVGSGERAARIQALLEKSSHYGIRLAGVIPESDAASTLQQLLGQQIIDEIIFAVDSGKLPELEEVFLFCDEEGVRTRVAVDFFPHVNSEVYLDRLGPAPLLTFSAAPHDEIRLMIKRGTDMLLAAAAMVLLAPFMLLVVMVIRVTSPGPAIFRQVRCGLNGRKFVFYKFRSMVDNAEQLKESLRHLNEKETAFKIPNDPRLTPVGRWLRKFSIDELPQFWNVLKGDMSLVGPRPAVPEEVDRYKRWQRRRLRMRPGLTCLWALSGRDHLDFETWMRMDMQYVDNWSLGLDWKILLKTVPQVLMGKGAH